MDLEELNAMQDIAGGMAKGLRKKMDDEIDLGDFEEAYGALCQLRGVVELAEKLGLDEDYYLQAELGLAQDAFDNA